MKLYELFPNFIKLSYSKKVEFLRSYRAKRALELEQNIKSKKASSKVTLSDEEKALIKMLGITQKDLKTLKGSLDNEG